jgi:hypothetical protein
MASETQTLSSLFCSFILTIEAFLTHQTLSVVDMPEWAQIWRERKDGEMITEEIVPNLCDRFAPQILAQPVHAEESVTNEKDLPEADLDRV